MAEQTPDPTFGGPLITSMCDPVCSHGVKQLRQLLPCAQTESQINQERTDPHGLSRICFWAVRSECPAHITSITRKGPKVPLVRHNSHSYLGLQKVTIDLLLDLYFWQSPGWKLICIFMHQWNKSYMPLSCRSLLTSVWWYRGSLKRPDWKGHEGLGNLIYNNVKNKGLFHEFESGSLVQGGAYDNKLCIMVSVKGKDLCITEGQWYLFDPDCWVQSYLLWFFPVSLTFHHDSFAKHVAFRAVALTPAMNFSETMFITRLFSTMVNSCLQHLFLI